MQTGEELVDLRQVGARRVLAQHRAGDGLDVDAFANLARPRLQRRAAERGRRPRAGYAGPLAVEQFKGGQSNPTHELLTPGRTFVMRTKPGPVAKLLPSAHAIEREFLVMRALQATDVPVPEMMLLDADESIIGRAFYVIGFVEGRVLPDPARPGVLNAERAAVYDELNRVIAACPWP